MVGLKLEGVGIGIVNLSHLDVERTLFGVGLCILRSVEEHRVVAERCRRVATGKDNEEVAFIVGVVAEVQSEVALQVFHRHVDAVPFAVALEVGHRLMESTIALEGSVAQDDMGSMPHPIVDDEVERSL